MIGLRFLLLDSAEVYDEPPRTLSPPQWLPLGDRNIESARRTMGKGKREKASSPSPSHCPPRPFFPFSSALPTIQRVLCGGGSLRKSAWEASLDFEFETTMHECGSALSSLRTADVSPRSSPLRSSACHQ